MNSPLATLFSILLFFLPSLQTSDTAELEARLDDLVQRLDREREEAHIPGMAIAVVADDRVVLTRGFGLARLEDEVPVTEETLFAIGSASKAFTATLMGMIVDQGEMAWDDPVTDHLPDFDLQVEGGEVTLRDLLSHRTGFTRMSLLWAAGRNVPRKAILDTATRAEPLAGYQKKFLYNNVMFLAAGEATAAAAEQDWDSLLAERLLQPIGMKHSNTSVTLSQEDPRLAHGYTWIEESEQFQRKPMVVLDSIAPAGAINSDAKDMAQWLRFQLGQGEIDGQRLIAAETLAETRKAHNPIVPTVDYGLGWFLREWDGQPLVEHGGNIDGFCSQVAFLPESGIGYALLMNVTGSALQQGSIPIVFEALLGARKDELSAHAQDGPEATDDLEDFLGPYIGNFAQFKDAEFEVLIKNEALAVDVPGQMVYELRAPDEEGKREFVLTDQIAVRFERDDEGKVIALRLFQAGFEFEMFRKGYEPEPDMPLSELARFVGQYEDEERLIDVSIRNNRLSVAKGNEFSTELYPPNSEGRWAMRIKPELTVEFEEDEEGAIAGMKIFEGTKIRSLTRVASSESQLPTLDEILALRGFGGDAPPAPVALKINASVHMVHSGLEGHATIYTDGDRGYRVEMDFGEFGGLTRVTNGARTWRWMETSGTQELFGAERDQALLRSPGAVYGDWRRYFDDIVVLRTEQKGDRRTWVLRLTHEETPPFTYYVDCETGDVLETHSIYTEGPASLPIQARYEDFETIEGVRVARREISENEANGKTVIELESLETGVELESSMFSMEE